MKKIKEFFAHPLIQVALCLGFTIILLAYISKRVLHTEFTNRAHAIPGFIAIGFEYFRQSKKLNKYARVLYWNIGMIASALAVIAYYYYRQ